MSADEPSQPPAKAPEAPSAAPPSEPPRAPSTAVSRLPPALLAAGRLLLPYLPALSVSVALGHLATGAILERAGHPAMPLDDSFIHLVYARSLSLGRGFEYVAGEGTSTGATSFLWPILLAPFSWWHRGGDPLAVIRGAWWLGTLLHAATAVETGRVARALAGRAAGFAAQAMCLAFGAFAWFAWSGMETLLFAWLLVRSARVAAAALEPSPLSTPPLGGLVGGRPSKLALVDVALTGAACALSRPEGALGAALALGALGFAGLRALRAKDSAGLRAAALLALVPVGAALLVPVSNVLATGHATSSTTMVKWLPASPHHSRDTLTSAVYANARMLLVDLLDGSDHTAIFLPKGFRWALLLGVAFLPSAAGRGRAPLHAVAIAAVALGSLAPATYMSFLWNRVRYVWPFATAYFVLIACAAAELGRLGAWAYARAGELVGAKVDAARPAAIVPGVLGGLVAGALAGKLDWAVRDLAQSAHAIDRQQVALGEWAREHLPPTARIGVNDTGAIAYLSGRPTFDVVGLTTEGEAPYWVSGSGARFEHYERLPRERLPTHFFVYPHWMAMPAVLGEVLHSATVTDQSILGGQTMTAYEARWDLLGSGARPLLAGPEVPVHDELDVADRDSERAHGVSPQYLWDAYCKTVTLSPLDVVEGTPPLAWGGLDTIAEGGRAERTVDAFRAKVPAEGGRLVLRVGAEAPVTLEVADEAVLGRVELGEAGFTERVVDLPARSGSERWLTVRRVEGAPTFTSYHYWVLPR
jgi:hypothetical protein